MKNTAAAFVFFALSLTLIAAACNLPTLLYEPTQTPSPIPSLTSTPTVTPTPTITPTPTPTPIPTAAFQDVDLVFISDSSGRRVGEQYADFIETDLGIPVTLHDFSIGSLKARSVKNYLYDPDESDYNPQLSILGLRELLAEAEIVVFYANPRSPEMGDWNCASVNAHVNDCSLETFEAYKEDLRAIFSEIIRLRDGEPQLIRAYDAYNPLYSAFTENGLLMDCVGCMETYNLVIHQVAGEFGIPVALVFDTFNGPAHDEDPREKGFIGPDGIHTSPAGSAVIAQLLRELGYEIMREP